MKIQPILWNMAQESKQESINDAIEAELKDEESTSDFDLFRCFFGSPKKKTKKQREHIKWDIC